MILAGDIGGTKTNLAYCELSNGRLRFNSARSYPSQQHGSLGEIIEKYVHDCEEEITAAAFGIAGPVINGRCEATNLPWTVEARETAALLHLESVGLVNDLEATAYGTLRLGGEEKCLLNEGNPAQHGTIVVIAAGTGLGEGGLFWNGTRYQTLPSEGGHSDFAPRDELEMDILRFLLERHDRVSWERVLSGPGLFTLYEFFRSRVNYAEPQWLRHEIDSGDPSAAVSRAGLERKDDASIQALETFVSLYGAEAGNLALKLLSTGGVFIAGGIAPKILPMLQESSFVRSFMQKGRLSAVLDKIPVAVVLNDKTALYGAAHLALMMND